jgi:hypothetical protein
MRKMSIFLISICILETLYIGFIHVKENIKHPPVEVFFNEKDNSLGIVTLRNNRFGYIRFYDDYKLFAININDDDLNISIGCTEDSLKYFSVSDNRKEYRSLTQFDLSDDILMGKEELFKDKLWRHTIFNEEEEIKKWNVDINSWEYYELPRE